MSKPIVHYRGIASNIWGRAMLQPVDHPNHLDGHQVSNTKPVMTSTIVSWDKATGRIETQHTIYEPEPTQ